ncbi:EamA family transporter RarD [Novosphingobium aquimarinum]|uniref:EamA family transporter RarD n=1 Tax=Novosphingobium aquimarinum TaxID=2682494 RepID=UPI0012EBC7DA|nr:EamA family transporter RarD [Novosphingobium aquimarinum]
MSPEPPASENRASGLPYALAAYGIWGLIPLYFLFVRQVPALEMVGWRIIFTIPVCVFLVITRKQADQVLTALRNPRLIGALAASSVLIGANWLIYVIAIQTGHVLAASLGYYINPLVNVLLGTVLLKERLTRIQWLAVALAAIGVGILAWGAKEMLWISLVLAFSFSGYGVIRKLVPVESLPGLTVESSILLLPAIGVVAWFAASPAGSSLGQSLFLDGMLAAAGLVTAIPLLLFAVAARRMSYSALGFVQFLAPSLVFVLGLTVFGEPLRPVQLVCFGFIWSAIALFSLDLLLRSGLLSGKRAART